MEIMSLDYDLTFCKAGHIEEELPSVYFCFFGKTDEESSFMKYGREIEERKLS